MNSLRSSRLLLIGILLAPLVMAGYVGFTALLFLPLLGLRRMFPRGSTSSVHRSDGNAPLYSGVGKLCIPRGATADGRELSRSRPRPEARPMTALRIASEALANACKGTFAPFIWEMSAEPLHVDQ